MATTPLRSFIAFAFALVMAACSAPEEQAEDELSVRLLTFDELSGWRVDELHGALAAFQASCPKLTNTKNTRVAMRDMSADWRRLCQIADEQGAAGARAFFETHFTPVLLEPPGPGWFARLKGQKKSTALFTGYYEPELAASPSPNEIHSAPVLSRPDDLIHVDLGRFKADLTGDSIAGRVVNGRLEPYADRAAIIAGEIADRSQTIAWVDPVELFFLQIQGSGRLRFDNGDVYRVGYDGKNGHPYTAIGRVLVERGEMPLENVSLQSIKAWLAANRGEVADELLAQNASYVFFRSSHISDPLVGPVGAQGVALTPERSVAVDRRYYPLGAPVWIEMDTPGPEGGAQRSLERLFVAQDVGGAIKGAQRADLFWGAGAYAEEMAGKLRGKGRLVVLLPQEMATALIAEIQDR